MKKTDHRIPTIIGLVLLTAGIATGVYLIQRQQLFKLRASPDTTPKNVKITNITDTSFAVSWLTDTPQTGLVAYQTSAGKFTAPDDRDASSGQTQAHPTHHITAKNLTPNITYKFTLQSGTQKFDNSGKDYQVTTAPITKVPLPPSDTVWGPENGVINSGGKPASGAIIYLSSAGLTPQSALVADNGSWVIPLSLARSTTLTEFIKYQPTTLLNFDIQDTSLATKITATVTNSQPLPKITLGAGPYTFTQDTTKPNPNTPLPLATVTPSPPLPSQTGLSFGEIYTISPPTVTLDNPQNGETISTPKPEFYGTAPSGTTITVTVKSSTSSKATVKAAADGSWHWSPPQNLATGDHTITISWKDAKGVLQTIARNFTVLAAESPLPAFTATPSGQTPTPTPKPTPKLTVTPTKISTPSANIENTGTFATTLTFLLIGTGLAIFGTGLLFPKPKTSR